MITLDAVEARVLGSLVEKSLTTPELYPLTYNSLLAACNQKTSREPVMSLDEEALGRAVHSLTDKGLVERVKETGSRVPKFRHRVDKLLGGEDPKVVGVTCVLLLRGPQTSGELKTRTERLCRFESTAEVEGLLQDLSAKPQPFVSRLERRPGQKEARWRELFTAGAAAPEPSAPPVPAALQPAGPDRLAALEERVRALEGRLEALEKGSGARPS